MINSKTITRNNSQCYLIIHGLTVIVAFIIVMILINLKNYLLFHCIMELFSILIAFTIYIIIINSARNNNTNKYLVLLGISYIFIGIFDVLHMLSMEDMGVFPGHTANQTAQLWIIARFIESISLLLTVALFKNNINIYLTIGIYSAFSAIMLLCVFLWKAFPDCYIEGTGFTDFKIICEYIIIAVLASAIFVSSIQKKHMDPKVYYFMLASFILIILSEVAFICSSRMFEIFMTIGHIIKVFSYYCMYKAIVEVNLTLPYKELNHAKDNYQNFIQSIPEPVLVQQDEKLVFINKACMQLLGVSDCEAILGKQIWDFTPSESKASIKNHLTQLKYGVSVPTYECKLINMDGIIFDAEVKISPCTYDNEPATMIILHDISEQKKALILSQNLEKENQKLKEAVEYDKLKTNFFCTVSHELRTPLNVMLSATKLMEKVITTESPSEATKTKAEKLIKTVKQNCFRLLRLVNNTIDIAKSDSGHLSLNLQNCNIVSLVEDITMSVADYIKNSSLNLVFDTEVEEKILACDPDKIEKIMLNLLSNAIKFTNKNGEIFVNIYDRGDKILISVKDTGIGIPEDKLETIFERFYQVDQSLTRGHEGSGIGLSLIKSLVEIHGGKIYVKSALGKGSEFIVELPVRTVEGGTYVENNTGIKQSHIERMNVEFSDIYLE